MSQELAKRDLKATQKGISQMIAINAHQLNWNFHGISQFLKFDQYILQII